MEFPIKKDSCFFLPIRFQTGSQTKRQRSKCIILLWWAQVHHSRLRMGCSKLKADLFYKLHVIDNCTCACGYHIENASHYFLSCPQYHDIRQDLIATISNITRINIKTILFGDNLLEPVENNIIFDAVHKFIKLSQRFNWIQWDHACSPLFVPSLKHRLVCNKRKRPLHSSTCLTCM